ncbi:cuticle protein 10.9-like [Haemaphysalis longicornis]
MFAKVLVASVFSSAFAGGQYGHHGNFYDSYSGPLAVAAASPSAAALEQIYPPQPYSFGYDNVDEFGTQSFHKEQGDANNAKTGSYGYRDAYGVYRKVNYVADANGFRATIDTNEPGTAPGHTADAEYNAKPVAAKAAAKAASAPVAIYAPAPAYGAEHSAYGAHAPWKR